MTKNLLLPISLCLLFLFLAGCQQQASIEKEKQAISQLFEDNVHGLLNRDVEGLISLVADDRVVVEDGQILQPTHEETRKELQTQFKIGKYKSLTVLTPPIIHISSDGKTAWCASQAKLKFAGNVSDGQTEEVEFIDAALTVFEKRNGRWVEVANAETLAPAEEE
jgi:ketosteroid isomerase-like protein